MSLGMLLASTTVPLPRRPRVSDEIIYVYKQTDEGTGKQEGGREGERERETDWRPPMAQAKSLTATFWTERASDARPSCSALRAGAVSAGGTCTSQRLLKLLGAISCFEVEGTHSLVREQHTNHAEFAASSESWLQLVNILHQRTRYTSLTPEIISVGKGRLSFASAANFRSVLDLFSPGLRTRGQQTRKPPVASRGCADISQLKPSSCLRLQGGGHVNLASQLGAVATGPSSTAR